MGKITEQIKEAFNQLLTANKPEHKEAHAGRIADLYVGNPKEAKEALVDLVRKSDKANGEKKTTEALNQIITTPEMVNFAKENFTTTLKIVVAIATEAAKPPKRPEPPTKPRAGSLQEPPTQDKFEVKPRRTHSASELGTQAGRKTPPARPPTPTEKLVGEMQQHYDTNGQHNHEQYSQLQSSVGDKKASLIVDKIVENSFNKGDKKLDAKKIIEAAKPQAKPRVRRPAGPVQKVSDNKPEVPPRPATPNAKGAGQQRSV